MKKTNKKQKMKKAKMKIIIVTGTPGTGKTTIAEKTAKEKGYILINVNKLIEEKNLSEGYDKEKQCAIIDVKKLNEILINLFDFYRKKNKKGLVIDSHLSHYLPSKYVDLCVVTKCDLGKLRKRLEKRRYFESKIRENLDAEIFDVCYNEALEKGHKIKIIKT